MMVAFGVDLIAAVQLVLAFGYQTVNCSAEAFEPMASLADVKYLRQQGLAEPNQAMNPGSLVALG